jgi:nitric oxide reductase large subunit
MDALRWMRVVGDTVFAAGAIALVVAVARLTRGRGHGARPKSDADIATTSA